MCNNVVCIKLVLVIVYLLCYVCTWLHFVNTNDKPVNNMEVCLRSWF